MSNESIKTTSPVTGDSKSAGHKGSALSRLCGRFARDEEGVTVIEFSMIALPFLLLIVALLETALVYMTTLDLENAVKDASRQIRTGQAQTAALTQAQFRTLVCSKTSLISDCQTSSNLVIDVQSYSGFQTINVDPSDIYNDQGNFDGAPKFSMGSGLNVAVVRAYYKMKLFSQLPIVGLANAGPDHRMIDAIAVFRNEPF